jgi:hypothetical protein
MEADYVNKKALKKYKLLLHERGSERTAAKSIKICIDHEIFTTS